MADITKNIIFRIGSSMGPGGLASLQAGLQMTIAIGKAVAESIKELDKFAQVHQRLTIDIGEADRATAGLIDTMKLMTNANRLTQAGLNVTASEYAKLMKFSVQYAKATGQDATEASERLTQAITSGTTISLKRMGLEIASTGTTAGNFKATLEEIDKVLGNQNIKVENTSEAVYVLGNNWSTTTGLIWEAINASENFATVIEPVNELLSEFNNTLMEAPGAQWDLLMAEMVNSAAQFGFGIITFLIEPLAKLEVMLKGTDDLYQWLINEQRALTAAYNANTSSINQNIEAEKRLRAEKAKSILTPKPEPTPRRSSGARVTEKEPTHTMWVYGQSGEAVVTPSEGYGPGIGSGISQLGAEEMRANVDAMYREEELKAQEEFERRKAEIAENGNEYMAYLDEESQKELQLIEANSLENRLGLMHNFFASGANLMQLSQTYYNQLEQQNERNAKKRKDVMKAMFYIGKAATIGQIQIDAAAAIMGTWKSWAGVGPWGAGFAAAQTALIATTAALQTAIVAGQQFESPSVAGSIGMGATASPGGGTGWTAPTSYGGGTGTQQTVKVVIEMGDNAMMFDALVEENDRASMSGRRSFSEVA